MNIKLKKIGNSRGFTIPPQVLDKLAWNEGTELIMEITETGLQFTKAQPGLEEMLKSVPPGISGHESKDRQLRGREFGE